MPPTLEEWLAQKAALEKHLAWIDRQIAAARLAGDNEGPPVVTTSPPPSPPVDPLPQSDVASPTTTETRPEVDVEMYLGSTEESQKSVHRSAQQARSGCLIMLIVFTVLFAAALFLLPRFFYE